MEAAIIIGCLLFSAFFSGMEIAYVSSNKVYLGVEKKQLTLISKILTRLTENPTQFVTSMLVGNSIALVIYGYYMGNAVLRWFGLPDSGMLMVYQLLIQIAVTTGIILLTAEFVPKVFFQVYANTLIKALAIPAYIFYVLFNRVSKVVMAVSDFILVRLLHTKADIKQVNFSRGELGTYITEQLTGANDQEEVDSEIQIFQNALEFSGLKARDIMTPRTELAAVELNDPVAELKQLFIDTDYSKIVVYRENIDDIIGYIHSFELFKKPQTIQQVMVGIEYVPETIYIKELLGLLTRRRKSMAVVLDEYGGTSGIITVEDIIEELFGEIEDEHDDAEELTEEQLPDGSYLFSARLDVEYVNEQYGLNIAETDSYATLGGFIVHHAKEIPQAGEQLEMAGFTVIIEQSSGKKIELIKLIPLKNK
ncbi:hemolysin family protein [Flavobacterium subsaxonicum]|uniref:Hemolysin n=1 Tax=Flavobacterium subsaxonicum WB 4.1-42 = DSM 21790 TaxID=1121898 RepID=A0A0A2N0Y5_9FLAO|nr:hemolysin family protein [Flavobacterium subsaxonicum]KGO94115.1 hemolysin [Flavobacterium subsaxonicum WB 4.1-42 = DSM 21790]